jgi:hypothetical protein
MKKLLLLLIVFANISVSNACDICGCGTGNYYLGIMPQFQANFIGFRYRSFGFDSHLGGHHDGLFATKEYFQTIELWGRFYPHPRWQVLTFVPYQFNRQETPTKNLYLNGLGDISVLASYNLIQPKIDSLTNQLRHTLRIGAGVKTPTGKSSYAENDVDEVANPNFQLGTGSIDMLLNVIYTLRYQKWGLNTDLTYKINTANAKQYRFGNKVNGTLSLFYVQNIAKNFALMPNVGVYFENSGTDKRRGYTVDNTGGMLVSASLGLETYFAQRFSVGTNYQVPLSQNLASGQIKAKARFSLHLTMLF